MSDQQHSMDLNAYARLAQIREYPTHAEGNLIIITPSLADALNALIDAADEVAVAGPLADALADVRELHDYTAVRLGGAKRC